MSQVRDLYNINLDLMLELSRVRRYWEDAASFYLKVMKKDPSSLSEGQIKWLNKIEEDLLEHQERADKLLLE